MKMVRFAQVVARSGRPEAYTLWTNPQEDAGFKAALKSRRVMTVHQENVGTKADYGTVGFNKGSKGGLLVFPKSLEAFEGSRIVGIRYDLLKTAAAKPATGAIPSAKAPRKSRAVGRQAKPNTRKVRVRPAVARG